MSTGGCLRRIQPSVPAELRERVLIKGPAYEQPQSHDCQNKHERVLSQKSRPANLSSSNKSIYRKASHTHPQPGQNPFARLPHTTSLPPHPQSNKQSPLCAFFHNLFFGSRLLLTCHSLGALFFWAKKIRSDNILVLKKKSFSGTVRPSLSRRPLLPSHSEVLASQRNIARAAIMPDDGIQQLYISPSPAVALSYPACAVFLWLGDVGLFHARISHERTWPNHGYGRFC